ncbi:MAG: hypothetical protein JO216_03790 [Hyphomicrobiales bacterium]|nr:hypothetical protein [Hyphomicrobiales bacterium]
MTEELKALIDRLRHVEMTAEQATEQRRSFAYGNTHIENSRITRKLVAEIDRKLVRKRT